MFYGLATAIPLYMDWDFCQVRFLPALVNLLSNQLIVNSLYLGHRLR
jgi:hypothetical protein